MLEKIRLFRFEFLVCLFLFTAILAVYGQVKDYPFVNFDDDEYVAENAAVRKGLTIGSVTRTFTSVDAANWHPLTWISHMLDIQLFGLNAGQHHLMNIFFHIASTVLLFLILNRITRALWPSAFAAALFALHPLHVESVAWVAERKDVLSTFFWMLTLGAYALYVERPDRKRYLIALVFFALGLMAKPMLVTLPFVLLLLDYWPLGRLRTAEVTAAGLRTETTDGKKSKKEKRKKQKHEWAEIAQAKKMMEAQQTGLSWATLRPLVIEKIPFFTLSILSSVITLYAQKTGGAVTSLQVYPLGFRLMNALNAYILYVGKTIWPQNLSVFYPYPEALPLWQGLGAALVLALVTGAALFTARRFPYLTVGWLWYVGTLIPVIGFVQVGAQAMADRYTYIPSIGLFIVAAWGLPDLLRTWPQRKTILIAGGSIVIALLMVAAWKQVHYWKSDLSLFQQALAVTRNNDVAHAKVGFALAQRGHLDEARTHYEKALQINPAAQGVHNQLGIALASQGRREEAIVRFNEALALKPYNIVAHNNLGITFLSQGKFDQSLSHFKASLQIKPDDPEIQFLTGVTLTRKGLLDESILYFREALRLNPNHASAHNDLGIALARKGDPGGAIFHFREALRIRPDFKEARENLQSARAHEGRFR